MWLEHLGYSKNLQYISTHCIHVYYNLMKPCKLHAVATDTNLSDGGEDDWSLRPQEYCLVVGVGRGQHFLVEPLWRYDVIIKLSCQWIAWSNHILCTETECTLSNLFIQYACPREYLFVAIFKNVLRFIGIHIQRASIMISDYYVTNTHTHLEPSGYALSPV